MRPLNILTLFVALIVVLAACSVGGADPAGEDVVSGSDPSVGEDDEVTESPEGGLDGGDEGVTDTPSPEPDETETVEATEEATPTEDPTVSLSPSPPSEDEGDESALPAEWREDFSGDGVPDFVMAELGWDPEEPWCDLSAEVDCPGVGPHGSVGRPGETAVMVMLDSSGSMADEVSDGQKMDLAKEVVEYFAVATPSTTDLGFLVFGHEGSMDPADHDESCAGVEVLAELGEADHESVPPLLDEFSPTGFTPLALALETAGEAFDGREQQDNRVLLVSDGLETCDGDPVAEAAELHGSGVGLIVDVIAYDVPDEEHEALEAIAEAGGGQFRVADSGEELFETVRGFLQEGLARAHCMLDAALETSACIEERQDELGEALGAAVTDSGYEQEKAEAAWEYVNALAQDIEATWQELGEFYEEEYCELYEAHLELAERTHAVYGDDLYEDYAHVDERLEQYLGDDLDAWEERIDEAGGPVRCG